MERSRTKKSIHCHRSNMAYRVNVWKVKDVPPLLYATILVMAKRCGGPRAWRHSICGTKEGGGTS